MEIYTTPMDIIVCGDSSVGKSCIIQQLSTNTLSSGHVGLPTAGSELTTTTLDLDGSCLNINLWETRVLEEDSANTYSRYKSLEGVIFVYDVTRRCTFESLIPWAEHIRKFAPKHIQKVIVGNKPDLEGPREVDIGEPSSMGVSYRAKFYEISAKAGQNISRILKKLSEDIIQHRIRTMYGR